MNQPDINLDNISLNINNKITNEVATNEVATNEVATEVATNEVATEVTIDSLLNNESANYKKEPWCRLDKTTKISKINYYVNNKLREKYGLTIIEIKLLREYLIACLDKEKLQRVKEVDYKKDLGMITNIPSLYFEKTTRKFTLKRCEKRLNTLKSLSKPKKSKKPKKTKNANKINTT